MSTSFLCIFFFNDTATTEIYTLSLHDALPIWHQLGRGDLPAAESQPQHAGVVGEGGVAPPEEVAQPVADRSEEHTSELQSRQYLVCRLLLEKKKQLYM